MAEKKYQIIIDKILSKSELFDEVLQTHEDVKEFFENEMKCKNLPNGFVPFMQVFDGITFPGFSVFAIGDKDTIQMTYQKYSSEEAVEDFCSDYKMRSTNSKLFFFATDNRGGRYAFKKDVADEKIYYFTRDNLDSVITYSSFENLLEEKVDAYLKINN